MPTKEYTHAGTRVLCRCAHTNTYLEKKEREREAQILESLLLLSHKGQRCLSLQAPEVHHINRRPAGAARVVPTANTSEEVSFFDGEVTTDWRQNESFYEEIGPSN